MASSPWLISLGLAHQTAPVAIRERLAARPEELQGLNDEVHALGYGECVVVSTCNRFELYLVPSATQFDPAGPALAFLARRAGIPLRSLEPYLKERRDAEAVSHLYRVAAGLESLALGEAQILGQVRTGYRAAVEVWKDQQLLNRLFHVAFRVGKRVRTETALGTASRSIATEAVSLAKQIFGNLADKKVLLVGAGKMGSLVADELARTGVKRIDVTNRTRERAEELVVRFGSGVVHPFEELPQAMAGADIVLCATDAPTPVVTRAIAEKAMEIRKDRLLFVVDIAVPRDVEVEVGDLYNLFRYDLDDLGRAVDERDNLRRDACAKATVIVDGEAGGFLRWRESRIVVPTAAALRRKLAETVERELSRSRVEGAGEIARLVTAKLVDPVVAKLLSEGDPTEMAHLAQHLVDIFGLDVAPESPVAEAEAGITEEVVVPAACAGETPAPPGRESEVPAVVRGRLEGREAAA